MPLGGVLDTKAVESHMDMPRGASFQICEEDSQEGCA